MILNIYKPKGWTSFDVIAKLRGLLGIKKIGHAGTLDPLATGVLIVLTGKDTKKQDQYMKLEKEYWTKIAFGASSPTYDLEGGLTFSDFGNEKELFEKLKTKIPRYIGEIEQTIPPYSAKKIKGKRLYKSARKGQLHTIEIPKKKVRIHDIEVESTTIEEINTNKGIVKLPVLTCVVSCASGVYIRSLAYDLGQDLGVGGVLVDLVRTRVGDFTVDSSKRLDEFESS